MASVDVLVIGGGQAGLAASWRLKQLGCLHLVVDASTAVGDSWRRRYDSLTLFTPRSLSALPGMQLTGDPDGYAGRVEFANYLERYSVTNELPVMSSKGVDRLRSGPEGFVASLDDGAEIQAHAVLVCTGAFQHPLVPELSSGFSSDVTQLHVGTYRNPTSVGTGAVLVIGDGASGRDIAVDLASTHPVILATGKARRLFPERILGQSTWTWMDRVGLLSTPGTSLIGRAMRSADPFPDRGRSIDRLRSVGVDVRPRLVDTDGQTALFAGGSRAEVDSVIWAIGYRDSDDWIDVPRDATGLYFLGRPWTPNRASGLILGANRDSEIVVEAVIAGLGQP